MEFVAQFWFPNSNVLHRSIIKEEFKQHLGINGGRAGLGTGR